MEKLNHTNIIKERDPKKGQLYSVVSHRINCPFLWIMTGGKAPNQRLHHCSLDLCLKDKNSYMNKWATICFSLMYTIRPMRRTRRIKPTDVDRLINIFGSFLHATSKISFVNQDMQPKTVFRSFDAILNSTFLTVSFHSLNALKWSSTKMWFRGFKTKFKILMY